MELTLQIPKGGSKWQTCIWSSCTTIPPLSGTELLAVVVVERRVLEVEASPAINATVTGHLHRCAWGIASAEAVVGMAACRAMVAVRPAPRIKENAAEAGTEELPVPLAEVVVVPRREAVSRQQPEYRGNPPPAAGRLPAAHSMEIPLDAGHRVGAVTVLPWDARKEILLVPIPEAAMEIGSSLVRADSLKNSRLLFLLFGDRINPLFFVLENRFLFAGNVLALNFCIVRVRVKYILLVSIFFHSDPTAIVYVEVGEAK